MDLTTGLACFAEAIGAGESERQCLIEALRPHARIHRVADGLEPKFDQGRATLVYVVSGHAKLVARSPDGRAQVVAFHFKGDVVEVPSRADHNYSVCAIGTCELLAFAHAELLGAVRGNPAFLEAVFGSVIDGLVRCRENAINLGRKSASERVAGFLLTMARHGKRDPDGALVVELPMSRRDVSDCLGLTIETISRQISDLRKQGLIATPSRARVELLDADGLRERANHFASAK